VCLNDEEKGQIGLSEMGSGAQHAESIADAVCGLPRTPAERYRSRRSLVIWGMSVEYAERATPMMPYLKELMARWTQEATTGFITAVLLAVAGIFGHWLFNVIRTAWRDRNAFGISGFWIGECSLPSSGQTPSLEIWRYSHAGDRVTLKFFEYKSGNSEVHNYLGGGVFRVSKLSAYYYELKKHTYESGVIALELEGLWLKGVFAQFDPNFSGEPLHVSTTNYAQRRVKLRFLSRMKIFVGRPPFRTYEEVKKVYDVAVPTSGQNPVTSA